jgi:hypothetical protein
MCTLMSNALTMFETFAPRSAETVVWQYLWAAIPTVWTPSGEIALGGTGGSNLPRSAKQSVLFTYYLEIPANPSVTRRFCAQCEPEKAVSLQIR